MNKVTSKECEGEYSDIKELKDKLELLDLLVVKRNHKCLDYQKFFYDHLISLLMDTLTNDFANLNTASKVAHQLTKKLLA